MTIEEKLRKTLQTKTGLKEVINAKGGTITDETPFDEYITQVDSIETGTLEKFFYETKKGDLSYLFQGVGCDISVDYSGGLVYTQKEAIDISKEINFDINLVYGNYAFSNAYLTKLPNINYENTKVLYYTFSNCKSEEFNLPEVIDLPNIESIYHPFFRSTGIAKNKTLTLNILKKDCKIQGVFKDCMIQNLDKVVLNTDRAYNGNYMSLIEASNLQYAPLIKEFELNINDSSTSYGTAKNLTLDDLAQNNPNIEKITIYYNVPKVSSNFSASFNQWLYNCSNLTDFSLVIKQGQGNYQFYGKLFSNCPNITNVTLKVKLYNSITLSDGSTYGNLITTESLLNIIRWLYKNIYTSPILTIGSVNVEKLSNVYVKLVDTSGGYNPIEVGYEPFEICESTDEGAMTISEYVALKNWSIA